MNTTYAQCRNCGRQIPATAFMCPWCNQPQPGGMGQHFADSTIARPRATQAVKGGGATQFAYDREANLPVLATIRGAGRRPLDAAVIAFADEARLCTPPTDPSNVPPLDLQPSGSTNYRAAFEEALSLFDGYGRILALVLGDGGANAGGGLFGGHEQAAIKAAQEMKDAGARIAAIGFQGETHNPEFLRAIASGPSLCEVTCSGQVQRSFMRATTTLTQAPRAAGGKTLFIYLIDESGSMDEDNKKQEVQQAFMKSLEMLRQMA